LIRLVRNPHFREWSRAAKPDGYPDAIEFKTGVDARSALHAVERGDADWYEGRLADLPRRELDVLFARYAGQIHSSPQAATQYYFLNTSVPPFDRLAARRALNYAIDRRAALALAGGPRFAQPTCQILPPNFPGYRPYCPYTADADARRGWTAPDLPKARRLVRRSGTEGMPVTVWGRTPGFQAHSQFLVRLLRSLGYRASLRILREDKWGAVVSDPRRHTQTGPQIFGADLPAASNFLTTPFGCRLPTSGSGPELNFSRFCDPHTRALMSRALRRQQTDPAAAGAIWAQVDRAIVDQAPAVPLLNPKATDLVSRRTGNYQRSPQWGPLLDQFWVR
jgi:peptide/nickel transport system substrate-binding protein